jgi:putative colanic acid biosynthesis glycosyltransferase WcaI
VKILILTLVFPPDNVSTAHIVGRLAAEFAREGHQVVALTSTPHYHPDAGGLWRQQLRRVVGRLVQRSDIDGVTAYHVWMPSKNRQPAARVIAWLWFHAATTVLGMVVGTGSDVILAPSPPLTIGVEARLLGLRHRAPFVYNVQEVYPDVAVTLGAIRNRSIIRVLKSLESWVYAKARFVTVIGARMRSNLLAKGVPPEQVVTIPNFVDPDELPIRPANNPFAATHGLVGRFVVSYAGNFGVPQGLHTVIQAAQLLRDMENIEFVLIGDGSAAGELRRHVESEGLRNVRFLPFQPFDLVPDIYAASDICLVPQAEGTGLHGLPSKIYRIMACGRPMIGICDADSEVAELIREAQCGLVVRPNDPDALAVAVKAAFTSGPAWHLRGAQGRSFVQQRYSVREVANAYLDLFESARSGAAVSA